MAGPRILTRDLKVITDNHEGRITSLEKKQGCLDDHIQRHEDKYDPMLSKHDHTLYGEHGEDGLVTEMLALKKNQEKANESLDEIKDLVKWAMRLIVGGFILALIGMVMN